MTSEGKQGRDKTVKFDVALDEGSPAVGQFNEANQQKIDNFLNQSFQFQKHTF